MRIHPLLAAAVLALASAAAPAQTLKPGLWEISNKAGGNPQMDQAMAQMQQQLAAMPPEQRKQMEAVMAQRGVRLGAPGAGGGMTAQVCMTREMVERNDVPTRSGCTNTRHERSGNTMKVAFTCSNPPSSGEGEFTFVSPEAYRSHMTVRTQQQGRTETVTMDATGKWLKADCGSVKPPVLPKK